MKKILLILIIFLLFSNTVFAVKVVDEKLDFGGKLQATIGGTKVIDETISFGGKVGIYDWYNWSKWWTFDLEGISTPTAFTARGIDENTSVINLTWNLGNEANNTYIRGKKGSAPTTRADGFFLYNGTGLTKNSTGLDIGTRYYYSAWSWNGTQGFTSNYTTDNAYTAPSNPTSFINTSISKDSISLSWTKGTNATKTVICRNASGVADYPSGPEDGTKIYNGTFVIKIDTGLNPNTTYYYRAWSWTNPYSGGVGVNATTSAGTDPPTNLFCTPYDHRTMNITWTKGADSTVIFRKNNSYPKNLTDSEALLIYNDTGTSYQDVILAIPQASKDYYYRAWGWDGTNYSALNASYHNYTRPHVPYGIGTSYGNDTNITFTWQIFAGYGVNRTVIRKNDTTYITNPNGGALVYNGTLETAVDPGITSVTYYTIWTYNNVSGFYSLRSYVEWAGMAVSVFNESNPLQAVTNWSIVISNQDGTESYAAYNQNNILYLDVDDLPTGVNTIIQIDAPGYKQRTYYEDIETNQFYIIIAYLPPVVVPVDEGEGDDGGNTTEPILCQITVIDELEQRIANATCRVMRVNNATGDFINISVEVTDGYGQFTIWLIKDTLYSFHITKSGYNQIGSRFWIPSELIYVKTFQLAFNETEPAPPDVEPEEITFEGYISGTYLYINYTDAMEETINTTVYVYEVNYTTNTTTLIYSTHNTSEDTLTLNYTINTSNAHIVVLHYNHTTFGFQTHTLYFESEETGTMTSPGYVETLFVTNFKYNPFGWTNTFMWLFLVACSFAFGRRGVGISLMVIGGLFLFLNYIVGFNNVFSTAAGGIVPVLFIVVGVLVSWRDRRKEEGM